MPFRLLMSGVYVILKYGTEVFLKQAFLTFSEKLKPPKKLHIPPKSKDFEGQNKPVVIGVA